MWYLIKSREDMGPNLKRCVFQLSDASDIDTPPADDVYVAPGSVAYLPDGTMKWVKANDNTWTEWIGPSQSESNTDPDVDPDTDPDDTDP